MQYTIWWSKRKNILCWLLTCGWDSLVISPEKMRWELLLRMSSPCMDWNTHTHILAIQPYCSCIGQYEVEDHFEIKMHFVAPPSPLWSSATGRSCQCSQGAVSSHWSVWPRSSWRLRLPPHLCNPWRSESDMQSVWWKTQSITLLMFYISLTVKKIQEKHQNKKIMQTNKK